MRAAEFMRALATVIDALDNGTDTDTSSQTSQDSGELQDNPVMTSPLQQQNELEKATLGKSNPAIDKLIASDDIGEEGINANPQHTGSTADASKMAAKAGETPLSFIGKVAAGVR